MDYRPQYGSELEHRRIPRIYTQIFLGFIVTAQSDFVTKFVNVRIGVIFKRRHCRIRKGAVMGR